jgi:glycosyltransferase involved in cell wall biosynthesis
MRHKISEKEIKNFILESKFNEKTLLEKNSDFPKISIIIPSFNDGVFLEKTIISTLNQNYPNLELIIIDGGSTDETFGIIKKYDKFISYWVSEKDNGQSDALNKGFSIATGELVNEIDADDIFLPNALLNVGNFFKNNKDIDVIFGNMLNIDENDNVTGECVYTKFSRIVYQYEGVSLGSQSTFWKRELFKKIGMYDLNLKLSMDYDFFLKVGISHAKFKYIPYFFSAMRRHKGSLTENFIYTPKYFEEMSIIDKRYNKNKILAPFLKIYSMVWRITNYFLQGDIDYVFTGLTRRFKNKGIFSGR